MLNLRDLAEEARAVVLEARREAAAIVETAKATAAGIRNQAELDAQASDRADDEASAARGRELAEPAGAVVSELSAAKEQAMAAMRRDVVKLALELAAKIVGEVAVSDISAARGNLEKVLALSGRSGEIILKVNPSQHRRLGEHYRELTEVPGGAGRGADGARRVGRPGRREDAQRQRRGRRDHRNATGQFGEGPYRRRRVVHVPRRWNVRGRRCPRARRRVMELESYREVLRGVQPVGLAGRVSSVRGLTVMVCDFPVPIGAACRIGPDGVSVDARAWWASPATRRWSCPSAH